MGRWGHRMFEGDVDIDLAIEVGSGTKAKLSQLIHQTDMLAPQEAKMFYQTEEYQAILAKEVEEQRKLLDGCLCNKLFKKFRAKKNDSMYPEYRVIVLAALMMRAGATIKEDDLDYVRSILPQIMTRNGYALPIFDEGFRDPGKRQFEAALDNYKPGIPRDFSAPSCFRCGKVQADLTNRNFKRCGKCKVAHYCNKECQTKSWQDHKKICFKDGVHPGTILSLNV